MLSSALLATALLPGFTASATYVSQSMVGMDHATMDIASCMDRHQTPTAPLSKGAKQLDHEERETPTPPEGACFTVLRGPVMEPLRPPLNLLASSSFVPPDIVILTTQLRI